MSTRARWRSWCTPREDVTAAGEGLLVYPDARLVVVRTLRRVENGYDQRYDDRDGMEWLVQMADAIALEKLGRTGPP